MYDEAVAVRGGAGGDLVVTATATVRYDTLQRASVLAGGDGCDAEPEELEAYGQCVVGFEKDVRR